LDGALELLAVEAVRITPNFDIRGGDLELLVV
jgi:hypothetical protein